MPPAGVDSQTLQVALVALAALERRPSLLSAAGAPLKLTRLSAAPSSPRPGPRPPAPLVAL
eukprot:8881475-Pyramimonas_sp.AAC.1